MTPGPGLRKCTEYLSPGPGGMPLALRLSDWLGLARQSMARLALQLHKTLILVARIAGLGERGQFFEKWLR